jgi:hypothetical protein
VEPIQGQVGELQSFGGGAGEDGMTLFEKGVEGTTQAIVVEFIGGEVPEDVGSGLVGPGRDIDQGGGLAQPRRHQQTENLAVGEIELGIWGQMAVDDAGNIELASRG